MKPTDNLVVKVNQGGNVVGALVFNVSDIINGENLCFELLPESTAMAGLPQASEGTRGGIEVSGVPNVPGGANDKAAYDPKLYATLPILPKANPVVTSIAKEPASHSQPKLTVPPKANEAVKSAEPTKPPQVEPKVEVPIPATVATSSPPAKSNNFFLYLSIIVVIIALILGYFFIL